MTPSRPTNFEILLGRSLAACLHPVAWWRLTSARGRAALVAAYAAAGYAGGLAALVLFAS